MLGPAVIVLNLLSIPLLLSAYFLSWVIHSLFEGGGGGSIVSLLVSGLGNCFGWLAVIIGNGLLCFSCSFFFLVLENGQFTT